MIKDLLKKQIAKATGVKDVIIEVPPNPQMGDFSTAIAFSLAKKQKRNPKEQAEEIANNLRKEKLDIIDKITTAGPYINFFVNMDVYSKMALEEIRALNRDYGKLPDKNKRVIVEHTSVNPTKPLHMGTARNSILGDSIAILMKAAGYDVEVDNYIDDLGVQFAEVYWGILKYGEESKKKYDHFLGKLYVKVHNELTPEIEDEIKKLNKELEDPLSANSKKARKIVESCVKAQMASLASLGIEYDLLVWESDIVHAGLFEETFDRLKESDEIELMEDGPHKGCLVMKLGTLFPNMKNPDKVLIRSDGTPTYTAKDIALQMWKFGILSSKMKYKRWDGSTMTSSPEGDEIEFGNADIVINVIGSEQSYPQEVVKQSLKLIGYGPQSDSSYHLAYEFVTLPEDKFSGRKGTWIGYSLDDVIIEGKKKSFEEIEKRRPELPEDEKDKIAEIISAGSIRYNIIKYAPEKKIVFRWEDALNMEGDSCPYIQYAHARCSSILSRFEGKIIPNYKFEHIKERELIKLLAVFPDIVEAAARDLRPHYITKYLNDVATKFNSFYNELPVLKSAQKQDRLALVETTKIVLANGMRLLGIIPLEEM